jgi:hypothetical protein
MLHFLCTHVVKPVNVMVVFFIRDKSSVAVIPQTWFLITEELAC